MSKKTCIFVFAANYGMPINSNLCENKFVQHGENTIMLQAASIYSQGDGAQWSEGKMLEIMMEIAQTSLKVLASDLFHQLTKGKSE